MRAEISSDWPIRIAAPPSAAREREPLAALGQAAPGDEAPDHQDQAAGVAEQRGVGQPGHADADVPAGDVEPEQHPAEQHREQHAALDPPSGCRLARASSATTGSASATRQNPAETGPLSARRTNHAPIASATLPPSSAASGSEADARGGGVVGHRARLAPPPR